MNDYRLGQQAPTYDRHSAPLPAVLDRLGPDVCVVHWMDSRSLDPSDEELLSTQEKERLSRIQDVGARAARVAAAALLRRVVGEATGRDPREVLVERTCPRCGGPHGRPTLPGLDHHASATHSGHLVGVALCSAGPVGLDVERWVRFTSDHHPRFLGTDEHAGTPQDRCRYWTRKEAAVKATGDGIGVDLRSVLVSRPQKPAELIAYPRRPGLRLSMADLPVPAPHLATVAVVTDGKVF